REGVNKFFLGVTVALISARAWLGTDDGDELSGAAGLVCLAGAAVAVTWWAIVTEYRKLNSVKFELIGEIEESLPIRFFSAERARLNKRRDGAYIPVSKIEQALPLVAAVGFVALLLWS
ncbi:MAG: hypothetical protein AAFZ65_20570, partial [Planctomycetota bacterium]